MNQQPDKLFRDKLENYQKAAPTGAWDRIAASQDKKKTNRAWLKIAASVLLVAGAGALWMVRQSDNTHTSSLAENRSAKDTSTSPETTSVQPESTQPDEVNTVAPESVPGPEVEKSVSTNDSNAEQPRQTKRNSQPKVGGELAVNQSRVATPLSTPDSNDTATRNKNTSGNSEPSSSSEEVMTPAVATAAPVINNTLANAAQGVTLTYSTQDVSAYLDKNVNDDATEEDKKQSTLKKLLQKANDLKTNQDPFGELRQRKNEILALNFMNDKRGQKTRN